MAMPDLSPSGRFTLRSADEQNGIDPCVTGKFWDKAFRHKHKAQIPSTLKSGDNSEGQGSREREGSFCRHWSIMRLDVGFISFETLFLTFLWS